MQRFATCIIVCVICKDMAIVDIDCRKLLSS